MNLLENIRQSLRNVKDNLLRSILTMMIIAFGIMALVGILTAIDSILISMSSNFSGLGANSFAITPLDSDFGPRHRGMRKPPPSPSPMTMQLISPQLLALKQWFPSQAQQ